MHHHYPSKKQFNRLILISFLSYGICILFLVLRGLVSSVAATKILLGCGILFLVIGAFTSGVANVYLILQEYFREPLDKEEINELEKILAKERIGMDFIKNR